DRGHFSGLCNIFAPRSTTSSATYSTVLILTVRQPRLICRRRPDFIFCVLRFVHCGDVFCYSDLGAAQRSAVGPKIFPVHLLGLTGPVAWFHRAIRDRRATHL